jgi:tetratricopeptide (TPR) repeat protein
MASRLEALETFFREDPVDPFTRFALASEYRKAGRMDEAAGFFEALVRDHPDYVGTYYHLGKLYQTLKRMEDARATYQAGIDVAVRLRDLHAKSELRAALMEAEEWNQ